MAPAFTEAIVVIVTVFTSVTAGQGPLFVETRLKLTMPALISAGVIKYVVLRLVLPGLKAPEPLDTHMPVFVTPLTVPVSATEPVLEQSVGPEATLAVASVPITTLTVSLTAAQGPLLVEVSVKIAEPLAISVGVIE